MESDDRAVVLTAAAELFDVLLDAGRFADLGRLHHRVVELEPTGGSLAEVRVQAQLMVNVVMAVEPDLALPAELGEIDTRDLSVDRDIDRYLLVFAAIHERTMQDGTTERLVQNLRRAIGALEGVDDGTLSLWDARAALEAATFLADDEVAEADAILDRLAPSVSRLRGAAPTLQAELEHRRLLSALAKGEFEDVLAAISLVEQRAVGHEESRFTVGHRFVRGWIAFQRGDYVTAGELLAGRTGEDPLYPALAELLSGEPQRVLDMLSAQGLSTEVDGPVTALEVELDPHLVASHAYGLLGDREGALREADREVAIRREYGPRFRLAQALRRRASFEPARQAVEMLAEALELAESTPRKPVTARVLASYGAALRRAARMTEAREALYRAIDMAVDMGMERLSRARLRRARARRWTSAADTHQRPTVLDRGPATGGVDGRGRPDEPADRRGALRHHQDRRDPSGCRLPQARHQLARRARRPARHGGGLAPHHLGAGDVLTSVPAGADIGGAARRS